MNPKDVKKEYSNGEITIVWQSAKCIHSGNCVKNSPKVFQPKSQPWIRPEAASTDELNATVNKCPSGALTYYHNETVPETYTNLIEAIDGLRKQGYAEDFNLKQNCIECRDGAFKIFHDEFHLDKSFRFDDDTDPSQESIIYAISSEKFGLKGILINGYGISSEPLTDEMLEKLK
jgi:uncharacterized Fe-S cluster protein YjdI